MASPSYTLIRDALVLLPGRTQAEAVDLLLEGDTIREIGPRGMSAPEGAEIVAAAGKLVHAGLVNAHTHAHGALAKAMGDRWSLELLLAAGPWISGNRSFEDKYLSAALNGAEMVLKGTTACYDLFFEVPAPTVEGMGAIARAYQDVGMRATIAPMVADRTLYEAIPGLYDSLPEPLRAEVDRFRLQPYAQTLQGFEDFVRTARIDGERLKVALAPTIPHHCSDAFLGACRDCARRHGLGLHSHVSESKVQALTGIKRYGRTLTAHLDELGLLGPDFTVAHGVWLDGEDMRILGGHGASVAHNPASNMRLGSGLADVRAMLDAGVNVAIGTDGSNSGDNQNMYEATKLASFVSKVRGPDVGSWLTTPEALHAATEGGARALGFEGRIGRIATGYKADLVFVDLGHINWVPHNRTVNQIVHVEDGTAVRDVMIGGRFVVRDGRLLTLDMARLASQAEAARARLEAANAPMKQLAERLQQAVASFCIGLSHEPYRVERYGAPLA
ncbi:amidohydrolase family protein [Bosea sp. TWI1241]|uniref:amidohydrolase family protein n=1 Tax=Bosea sp. TWI1241 TaxID=3148904 RepID=UPI003208C7D3